MGGFFSKIDKKYIGLTAIIIGVYLFMRFFLPVFLPFLIAIFMVVPLHPFLGKLEKKTRIGKGFLTTGILLLAGGGLLLLVWFGAAWAGNKLVELSGNMDFIEECFCGFVRDGCRMLEGKMGFDAVDIENLILDRVYIFIDNFQMQVVPRLMDKSFEYVKNVGSVAAFVVVTFIAIILFAKDYDLIVESGGRIKGFQTVIGITKRVIKLIHTFLKAQLVILSLISFTAIIGLLLGRISGAVYIGIAAGILDALPFIGTGIVLLPLSLWQLIQGNIRGAVFGVLTYVTCAVMREFLEPKLIGRKMGIYPVGILISIYGGVKVYGLGGIILGPLSILIIKELYVYFYSSREEYNDADI